MSETDVLGVQERSKIAWHTCMRQTSSREGASSNNKKPDDPRVERFERATKSRREGWRNHAAAEAESSLPAAER